MKVSGSFRDPAGFVFEREGRIFRALDQACGRVLREAHDAGLLPKLISEGRLVGTRWVEDRELLDRLQTEHAGYPSFLEHEALCSISYPYEWTVSMLADAAALTLDIQERLLGTGLSLKDATAYNVQFRDGRPVFIDLSSIERPARLDVWHAFGQFNRMFTGPLLLFRRRGWDLRSCFLGSLDGRDPAQIAAAFGTLGRWRPELLLDVTLPAMLNGWADRSPGVSQKELSKNAAGGPESQRMNLRRLRAKVLKLASGYRSRCHWAGYTSTCLYSAKAEEFKKGVIGDFLRARRPRKVLDIGCNTGEYSFLAAGHGARVTAVDSDHDSVELLYRRLRAQPAPITPMVVDLRCPSPGFGFRNEERLPFFERVDADCVFALALMHHLAVNGNLSLDAIRDLFADLTRESLVFEFVPHGDPQFERLTKLKTVSYENFTLEACLESFARRFSVEARHAVPDTPRTLLFLRKKAQRGLPTATEIRAVMSLEP